VICDSREHGNLADRQWNHGALNSNRSAASRETGRPHKTDEPADSAIVVGIALEIEPAKWHRRKFWDRTRRKQNHGDAPLQDLVGLSASELILLAQALALLVPAQCTAMVLGRDGRTQGRQGQRTEKRLNADRYPHCLSAIDLKRCAPFGEVTSREDYARWWDRTIHFRTSSATSIMAAKGRMKSHALAPIGAVPKMKLPSGV
jgi:hypothetical protein